MLLFKTILKLQIAIKFLRILYSGDYGSEICSYPLKILCAINPNFGQFLKQEIKSATSYQSYDDSNIDDKEQVRDLGITMSNTATFTFHIRNIVLKARDKMG